jgi:hypothetical protein
LGLSASANTGAKRKIAKRAIFIASSNAVQDKPAERAGFGGGFGGRTRLAAKLFTFDQCFSHSVGEWMRD